MNYGLLVVVCVCLWGSVLELLDELELWLMYAGNPLLNDSLIKNDGAIF